MALPYINTDIEKNLITNRVHLKSGAQGHVYKAEYVGQIVAVKEKWTGFDEKLFAKLHHPHIVRIIGLADNKRFLIMEYCNRQLHTVLHDTPVTPIFFRDFKNWSWQLANALEYLHNQKIIHRDLKSPNILIAMDNGIRLCDFDLSKISEDNHTQIYQTRVGTMRWMAPEVNERKMSYTKRADVWSYGVVIWEMVTQQIPYLDVKDFDERYHAKELHLPFPLDLIEPYRSFFATFLDFLPENRPNFKTIRQTLEGYLLNPALNGDEADWATKKERWMRQAFKYNLRATISSVEENLQNSSNFDAPIDEEEIKVDEKRWIKSVSGFGPPNQFHFVGTPFGTRFHVNFEINDDVVFHFNPIFKRRNQVVRNALRPGSRTFFIDEEECGHIFEFPFKLGRKFTCDFIAGPDYIEVYIDEKEFTYFKFRHGYTTDKIDTIEIVGNVDVHEANIMRG